MSLAVIGAIAWAVAGVALVVTIVLAVALSASVKRSHDMANGIDPDMREALSREPKL